MGRKQGQGGATEVTPGVKAAVVTLGCMVESSWVI